MTAGSLKELLRGFNAQAVRYLVVGGSPCDVQFARGNYGPLADAIVLMQRGFQGRNRKTRKPAAGSVRDGAASADAWSRRMGARR